MQLVCMRCQSLAACIRIIVRCIPPIHALLAVLTPWRIATVSTRIDVFQRVPHYIRVSIQTLRICRIGYNSIWADEPVTSRQKPVIDNPRVISTGHYAWYSDRSTDELQKRAAENMIALLEGKSIPDRLV